MVATGSFAPPLRVVAVVALALLAARHSLRRLAAVLSDRPLLVGGGIGLVAFLLVGNWFGAHPGMLR